MSLFKKNKTLVTHDGTFHADDLFASAVLSIVNDGNVTIIRSRDPQIIAKGDYVYDVGGEYDPSRNRFDHHQKLGAGTRDNGIPYASFGLVWKHYGEYVSGSKTVADILDRDLVSAIDAVDNGVDAVKPIFDHVLPAGVEQVYLSYSPTWKESNKNIDSVFTQQVAEVVKFLKRKIEVVRADVEGTEIIMKAYNSATDKRLVIINNDFPRYLFQTVLSNLPEPLYLIYPSSHSDTWKVEAISKQHSLESRKLLPVAWRGYFNSDPVLAKITGVPDATFCHRSGFLITAKSKEGAISLAQKALIA